MSRAAFLGWGILMSSSGEEIAAWDLDADDGGFTASAVPPQWEWGDVSSGPMGGYDGERAWGTVLDRSYLNDSSDGLTLPSVDLTDAERPVLTFWHWYEIAATGDAGWVEVWDGAGWQVLEPVYGYPEAGGFLGSSGGWEPAFFDLSGVSDSASVRLVFSADERIALAGWYVDNVAIIDGDPVPPDIAVTGVPDDTQDLDGPYVVTATITDDYAGLAYATLIWSDGGDTEYSVTMEAGDDGAYWGEIPAQPAGTTVRWHIEASDGWNTARAPADDDEAFRVYLAAPTDLAGPEGRVVGVEATLTWTAPESPEAVDGYRVYRDSALVAECAGTTLAAPLDGPIDWFEVSAVYGEQEGDLSLPLMLRVSVPTLEALDPAEAWQGDSLRVAVSGTYLLFVAEDASLDLGDGVVTSEVEVIDADHAVFTLELSDDAEVGLRDALVISGATRIPVEGGFEVLSGDDRPTLVGLIPDALTQGEQTSLTIASNAAFAEAPVVDLGDGIIVESVVIDENRAYLRVTVAADAPVGTRPVSTDDGARILHGVDLRVRAALTTPTGSCAAAPSPTRALGPLGLLVVLVGLRRRARAPARSDMPIWH